MISLTPQRKAFSGILILLILFFCSFLYMGKQNFWFEKKVIYTTHLKNAEGLRAGTSVNIAGLKVGEIISLNVNDDQLVETKFYVKKSMASKVKTDSIAKVVRSLMIGEKRIEISKGTSTQSASPNSVLEGHDSQEIADLLSGGNMQNFMNRFDNLGESLDKLSTLLAQVLKESSTKDQKRKVSQISSIIDNLELASKSLPPMLNEAKQTLHGLNQDVVSNHLAKETLENVKAMSDPFAKNQELLAQTLGNISILSKEFSKNPQMADKLIGALNETTITLKAIQRTWMLSDHVKELEKEHKTQTAK